MNKLLSSVGVALMCLLAGCSLYFGSSGNGSGDGSNGPNGPAGGGTGGPGGGTTGSGSPPGFQCNMNSQCAAGCFCSNGVCTEGGFCSTDKDCGNGFHCDTARSSCTPNPVCTVDTSCTPGSVCDATTGGCVATCACTNDADAVKQGFGWCDEARNTCMKGTDPAGMCLGPVTCTTRAPACPDNQVALVKDGCYTGQCRAITACEGAPVCTSLQHQDDCDARTTDCSSVFLGHNCHGTTCGTTNTDCVCDSYTFQGCDVKGTPVIVPGG